MTAHPQDTHPWREDLPAFALGALDAGDRTELELHLDGCEACRAALAAERALVAALAHAAPRTVAPSSLRARILAEARAATPPVRVATQPVPLPRAIAPTSTDGILPMRRRGFSPMALAAAASIVVAFAMGGLWRREDARRGDAERAFAVAAREAGAAQAALAARDSLLAAVLAPEVATVQLAATGQAPTMRLDWNRQRGVVVLSALALPPAAPGRTYQLWGIRPGEAPRSLGTFSTDASGRATVSLRVGREARFAVSAVSVEPTGGSPAPTTTPILVGEWGKGE